MHGYLDPIGYSVLNTNEKAKIERDLKHQTKNNVCILSSTKKTTSKRKVLTTVRQSEMNGTAMKKKITSMEKFLMSLDVRPQMNQHRSLTIAQELVTYGSLARKNASMDAIHFWKEHGWQMPILKAKVQYYLATPGTSVPSECAFSRSAYLG